MTEMAPPRRCDCCGRAAKGFYSLLGGRICNVCYSALRRNPSECPSCGDIRVLAFVASSGVITCATCAGEPPRFACASCGSEQFLAGSHCGRCRLQHRLDEIVGPDVSAPEELQRLRRYLIAAPMDPRSVVKWLRRPRIARTLTGMANGSLSVGHAAIDLLPQKASTRYFRRLLISAGVLPPIHVLQHELTMYVSSVAGTLERNSANTLRRFYRWEVLPRLHRRYRDRGRDLSVGTFTVNRGQIRVIARFLTWLLERDLAVAELDQATLNHYTARNSGSETVNHFVRWAMRSRLAGGLITFERTPRTPLAAVTEDELWSAIDILVEGDDIEREVRIVGLFTLLYAQPLERSVSLTRDRVSVSDQRVSVRFGSTPIELEGAVGELVRLHLAAPPRRGYAVGDSEWVFEGMSPGAHLSAAYIRLRLREQRINARVSRETRMNLLAMRMPAAVLADVVGVVGATADRRKERTSGIWSQYPDLRT